MTINSTIRKAGPFIGNGTASSFPFTYKVFQASDLEVVRLDQSTNVQTTLQLTTDYTVVLNQDQDSNPGGTVTLVAGALATGYTLTMTSDVPNLQPTDLTNQGGFYPEVINDSLDRATIQIQQLQEQGDRTLRLPLSSTADGELPPPSANELIGWNSTGTGLTNVDPSSLATVVAYATAYCDVFVGDGVTTSWTLTRNPAVLFNLDVSINGSTQEPTRDYTLTGTTFTMTTPPPLNSRVVVKYKEGLPNYEGDSQDVRFVPAGAGAVIRSAQSKLRDVVSVKDFGAVGDGITNDTAAIQAALTAGGGKAVYFPAGDYKLTTAVTIPNNTYVYGDGEGSRIFGDGTVGELLRGVWPCEYVTVDNLCLDGGKTNGTGPIVVCFYVSASTAQPTTYNKYITVRNCIIKNASAGVGVENGMYISAHHNTVQAMFYQLPGNPGAGVYGYGIVFNGCTRSSIENNVIGVSGGLIERHAIYMPVFRDNDLAPTFTNFCAEMRVIGNTCFVNPNIDPFSSCIESWSFFDCLIADNILIGGKRGIYSTPEYKNGGRVMIVNNIIKDSEIGIRNDRAIYGATPNTYYFEEWLIDGNQIMPLTSTTGAQGVSIQGVKKVTFTNNYVRHTGASSFAFGYYGPVNNITAESILSANNTIEGFLQGFYLANVVKFYDDGTVFKLFTGGVLPYVQNYNVQSKEMHPVVVPYTELWDLTDAPLTPGNWHGVQYFSQAVCKNIICAYDGVSVTYWVDEAGFQVRGTTASRPNLKGPSGAEATGMAIALPYGFEYYDTNVGATIYWNGNEWFTSQQPAVPASGTTTQLNDFKTNYPNALNSYNAISWNTTTSKPVFWNELTGNWVYADGTPI